jgi:hypothetical protein
MKPWIQHVKRHLNGSQNDPEKGTWIFGNKNKCEGTQEAIWLIENLLMKRMEQGYKPMCIVLEAWNSFWQISLKQLLIIWKMCSRPVTCVTDTMKGGWKLVSKICMKPKEHPSRKSQTLWRKKINTFSEIKKKGLWIWWHSERRPQATFNNTTG